MKNIKTTLALSTAFGIWILSLASFVSPCHGYAQDSFLQGKVHYLDKTGLSLKKKMDAAAQEFKQAYSGDTFFTGYVFTSRHGIYMGDKWNKSTQYKISVKAGEIKVRRLYKGKIRSGYSMHTEYDDDESGPAAIILLHKSSRNEADIQDAHLLDLNNTHEFAETPIYWLGEADTEDSFQLLDDHFESGPEDLQKTLLFMMSIHDTSQAEGFLNRVALGRGKYATKIRKDAIFWIGNIKSDNSLSCLKNIYAQEQDTKLREQVIFALHLHGGDGAIKEMFRIARQDQSHKVRKSAIFWLGQKASEESIRFLKDIVEGSDENDEIKKSAVFAISQLPQDRSVPMLINIIRTNKSPAVRKNAMFWLGQTGHEDALKFFEDILLKKQI